ncbi:MAG: DUF3015 family protein [Bdellovibrionales bacterium]|nr:DUF3015 family protein [Bdellovibrionales bacterium]
MKKLLIVSALIFSPSLFAEDIGPAGCGLGYNIFGGSDSQVLASTTNGSSGNQTFGITSGTSGCVDSDGMARLETFIEGNRVVLETEAARGEGEAVEGLAQILKCPSAEKVGAALKSSHSEVFDANAAPAEVGQRVKEVLKSNQVLCVALG